MIPGRPAGTTASGVNDRNLPPAVVRCHWPAVLWSLFVLFHGWVEHIDLGSGQRTRRAPVRWPGVFASGLVDRADAPRCDQVVTSTSSGEAARNKLLDSHPQGERHRAEHGRWGVDPVPHGVELDGVRPLRPQRTPSSVTDISRFFINCVRCVGSKTSMTGSGSISALDMVHVSTWLSVDLGHPLPVMLVEDVC